MSNVKDIPKDNLRWRKLPQSVSVTCENISAVLMMNYRLEKKHGITPYSYCSHDHTVYEAYIIESGYMQIDVGGKMLSADKDEILIVAPKVHHKLIHTSDDFKRFCIRFKFDTECDMVPLANIPYLKDKLTDDELRFIFKIINELHDIAHNHSTKLTVYRETSLLGVLFSYVLERIIPFDIKPPSETDGQIELYTKIENYLYLNYNQPITLDSLASYLSYSRTQMRRIIDDCYGMSFTEKLREIRLEAAKLHLAESNSTIEEIAAKCGYETRQGFESMFLKFIGVTPNQYRKKYIQ